MVNTSQTHRRCSALMCSVTLLFLMIVTQESYGAGELRQRTLSDGEKALIFGASGVTLALGRIMAHSTPRGVVPAETQPPGVDQTFRRWLHGEQSPKTNFLDNKFGSAVSPALALLAIGALDIKREEFSTDVPLFISGLAATKGITDFTKFLVRRPRPCCVAHSRNEYVGDRDHSRQSYSFFSGHASSVFYTATFFNRRFRRHMRQNWTSEEYRVGRVLSPLVSFGWATFVGMSRVHADRHYFTDVAVGALAGAIVGEVFYRLAYESSYGGGMNSTTPLFLIRIPLR